MSGISHLIYNRVLSTSASNTMRNDFDDVLRTNTHCSAANALRVAVSDGERNDCNADNKKATMIQK